MTITTRLPKELNKPITEPGAVFRLFRLILERESKIDRDKEHLWIIGLKTDGVIKYIELVSLGTLNHAPVHAREVFRMAIMEAVNAIIVVHNHPSGDPSPSAGDRRIYEKLSAAGELLGIEVLDFIVIGDHSHRSFKSDKEIDELLEREKRCRPARKKGGKGAGAR